MTTVPTPQRPKMDRHHSLDSPDTIILKKQRTEGDFQRSHTISERRISGSPSIINTTGRTSPLKRFGLAKESIFRAFGLIQNQLSQAQELLASAHGPDGNERMSLLLEKTKGIEDMLARDHMKVAFFGRTSNGKSTVVNALLHDKVLPSGIGHTTNCFCSVIGVDDSKGYILTPGSEEHRDIKTLQQLAHSLHKEHLSANSLVRVYWPKEKCSLLQEDVEFVDSPGIDMNPDVDDWINTHCLDADVFVLVSNAESTLMNAEKNFFYRVSERLSRPNIFILNNRWDASIQEEPEMMEEVKRQHLENDIAFLSQHLNVTDELTAKDRVYFVSAKEVVTQRIRQQNNEADIGRGLADGYKGRLLEFERFELKFKECLSSSAIKTKFEQHHSRGIEIVVELEQLLHLEEQQMQERSVTIQSELQQIFSRLQELNQNGYKVYDEARNKAVAMGTVVQEKVKTSMEFTLQRVTNIVDDYKDDFDPTKSESYKAGLYAHIDEHLKQELANLCPATLGTLHQQACTDIISLYQQLLNLSQQQVSHYVLPPPEVNHVIHCSELCQDFREDLEFRFSLGLFSFTKWINTGSLLFSLQRQFTRFTAIVPAELLFPVSLLAGGVVLSRLLSWRYLLPPTLLYVGVYMYEHLTWTDRAKEQRLKSQVVNHLRVKFDAEILAIKKSYNHVLLTDLQRLIEKLNSAFNSTQKDCEEAIEKLSAEERHLGKLQGQAHSLRNSVHLLKTDLDDFREEYLADID